MTIIEDETIIRDIARGVEIVRASRMIMLQREDPLITVTVAMTTARENNGKVTPMSHRVERPLNLSVAPHLQEKKTRDGEMTAIDTREERMMNDEGTTMAVMIAESLLVIVVGEAEVARVVGREAKVIASGDAGRIVLKIAIAGALREDADDRGDSMLVRIIGMKWL